MSSENNLRLIVTRAVLWLLVGIACTITIVRYLRGLGATTALTDGTPWGLWVGFDVLSGVALAAGGFVIAATVYIFHLERYHALVRPAVLTAFLGYLAVALGLMVDLGRPWNIWRPMFFWQLDSPLFEVAWCVMLYLTVLALELAPAVLERFRWQRALRLARRSTIVLVIAGIGLSTLHQSSLGTLFLLARDRLHPLWYSPVLPLLFFVSAVGLGLAMVTSESLISSWLFHRPAEWHLLRGLTRAAAAVISLYLVLRLGDLLWRGNLALLLTPSWPLALLALELLLSCLLPILLFSLPATRSRAGGVAVGAFSAVAGFVLHRANVGGIAHQPVTGQLYLPALAELMVSIGLVAAMSLIFLFFLERFPIWEQPPAVADHFTPSLRDPVSRSFFGGPWFDRAQLAALAWIVGVVLGVVLLELTRHDAMGPRPQPVRMARTVTAERLTTEHGWPTWLVLTSGPTEPAESTVTALLIDGDAAGRSVLFDHLGHQARLGGTVSCRRCHHRTLRLDQGTPCSVCHRDMYRCTDTFDHQAHVTALEQQPTGSTPASLPTTGPGHPAGVLPHSRGMNSSCRRCHSDPEQPRSRLTAADCGSCHAQEQGPSPTAGIAAACIETAGDGAASCRDCHPDSLWQPLIGDDEHRVQGFAPGYRWAMHRLCISCHCRHEASTGVTEPHLTRCTTCHRGQHPTEGQQAPPVRVAALGPARQP